MASQTRLPLSIEYAQTTAAERLLPAVQCTSTPPAGTAHIRHSAQMKALVSLIQVLGDITHEASPVDQIGQSTAAERLLLAVRCTRTPPAGKQS